MFKTAKIKILKASGEIERITKNKQNQISIFTVTVDSATIY